MRPRWKTIESCSKLTQLPGSANLRRAERVRNTGRRDSVKSLVEDFSEGGTEYVRLASCLRRKLLTFPGCGRGELPQCHISNPGLCGHSLARRWGLVILNALGVDIGLSPFFGILLLVAGALVLFRCSGWKWLPGAVEGRGN